MQASNWLDHLARELGVAAPTEEQQTALLSLASVAANASERLAAPISCWLVAVAGRSPEEGLALARQVAARLAVPSAEAGEKAGAERAVGQTAGAEPTDG